MRSGEYAEKINYNDKLGLSPTARAISQNGVIKMETFHVIKMYRREHKATGIWEEWQSVFTSYDGPLAKAQARNTIDALAFGFLSDAQSEGATFSIDRDEPDTVQVSSELGGATETVILYRTTAPETFEFYSRYSEHHEI